MAINREEITEKIFNGTRTPADGLHAPPMLEAGPTTIPGNEVLEFNADEAKKRGPRPTTIEPWATASF